jgi:hypothetical protein
MNRGVVGLHDIAFQHKMDHGLRTEAEKHTNGEKSVMVRLICLIGPTRQNLTIGNKSKNLLGPRSLNFHLNLQHDRKMTLVNFTSGRL